MPQRHVNDGVERQDEGDESQAYHNAKRANITGKLMERSNNFFAQCATKG